MFFIKRLLLCVVFILLFITACGKKEEIPVLAEIPEDFVTMPSPVTHPKVTPLPAVTPEQTEALKTEVDITGMAVNNLTGLYISEEAAARRPIAVVINNLRKALPQSGLAQADLYYEVLAEGDITRIIAVFKDFNSQKIGPVRSTRDYFLDFALDNDAIFIHHGGSPKGYSFISENKINNIDGMNDWQAFWRDPVRVAIKGMYEHSSYTNAEKILDEIVRKGYRTELKDGYSLFDFYDELLSPESVPANKVTIPFSTDYAAEFIYDTEKNVYKRYQAERPHVDEETGEQLEVANIIVQITSMKIVDNEGRRQVKLITDGNGYLVTAGQYVPITWSKASHTEPTEFFIKNGDKLKVNKGKTWICILQDYSEPKFE